LAKDEAQEQWSAVDNYIVEHLIGPDPVLDEALANIEKNGMPTISVSPAQGKQLFLLAKLVQAKRILEIGTLGAYSSIWLGRALPKGGKLITLEANQKHVSVAQANIAHAGLSDLIDVRQGKALDTLPKLAEERNAPFDFIFIDADKENIPNYFEWSMKLSHPGTLIVVDNVVREGALADRNSQDLNVKGCRRFHEMLSGDSRVSATTIQTVGAKGYDGFTMAIVL
jgi:predicted O-methyltransferase YrrM